jgi:hypothetical protein
VHWCIVLQDLCRARLQLQAAGVPDKALDSARDAALSALSLYGACLVSHLSAVPEMVMHIWLLIFQLFLRW